MSRPPPRPPPGDDTLALVPRDLRGASAGVAPAKRLAATSLRHHALACVTTAERLHAAGKGPAGHAALRRPVRPCAAARRTPHDSPEA